MILIVGKFIHHYMTDRMLKRAGLTRDHFQFCSLEENPYNFKDIKVFIPLGNEGIKKMLGEQDIFRWVNRTIPLSDGRWILPNFCPSQLVPYKIAFDEDEIDEEGTRTPTRLQGMAASIFKRASILAAGGEKIEWPEKNYLCDPTPLEFEKWARAMPPTAPLSFDIETPYFKKDEQDEKDFTEVNNKKDESILRISFSYEPHNACSIPFQPHYYDIIRFLLASPNDKVVWNGRTFDIPRLKANGFNTVGTVYDGMDMFHWVQPDLDKGLEFVSSFYTSQQPWKHINNSEPAKYSCIDADVALLCYLGIRAQIEKSGGWNAFKVAAVDCMEVLEEAGQRGNFIDVAAQEDLRQRLNIERERLESEIQLVVPKERKPVTEYSRRPSRFDYETTVQGRIKVCDICNQQISNKSAHHKGRGNPCRGGSVSNALGPVPRYVVIEPFNANSSKQLLEYAKFYNHPIGKNHKTGSDTIDVKVLQKLAGKYGKLHPLYSLTLELHKVSKALSTYVNGLAPDESGKVHTTFVNTPSTFRLASRAVNMQNQGKRESNKWAKEARRTIVAPPGFKIVQADSSSIEAVITGYLMNDEHYIDIAKRSVHAYLCCKWKGWEPTDENIRLIKKTEKELYEQLKRVVHGCLTGDHEVLTASGWVKFKDYDFITPIAEWDPKTERLTFKSPLDFVNKSYTGPMMHLKGTTVDAVATPDHRWPVWTSQGNIVEYSTATLPKANALPLVGRLSGEVLPTSTDIIRLVATQADGTFSSPLLATFHLKKRRKIERLQALGAKFKCYGENGSEYWTWNRPNTGLTKDKYFDLPTLLTWATSAREEFLKELPWWDGDCKNIYRTSSEENAKTVQTLAHITGYRAILAYRPPTKTSFGKKGYWQVRFSFTKNCTKASLESVSRTTFDYSGQIYCVKTSTGYFLTRYGNSVYVTGNTAYGMGVRLMAMNDPEIFPTVKDAKKCQDFLFETFPNLKQWQNTIRQQAQKDCYLVSPFNHRHYFYDVFTYQTDNSGKIVYGNDGLPRVKNGKDSKRAIAYLPQHCAGMFARQNLVLLGTTRFREFMGANVSVHDSYALVVPDELVESAADTLVDILTRPIPELGGLRIGCAVEVGQNWGQMEEIRSVRV